MRPLSRGLPDERADGLASGNVDQKRRLHSVRQLRRRVSNTCSPIQVLARLSARCPAARQQADSKATEILTVHDSCLRSYREIFRKMIDGGRTWSDAFTHSWPGPRHLRRRTPPQDRTVATLPAGTNLQEAARDRLSPIVHGT
jgi:hypothetical protein